MSKIKIHEEKCVHCGACTGVCSFDALQIKKPSWILMYNEKLCKNCGLCVAACPLRAIVSS